MNLNKYKFKRGIQWIRTGLDYYKKSKLLWTGITIAYITTTFIAKSIPGIGFLISEILSVFLLIGIMNGCRDLENNKDLTFEHLFSGFTSNAPSILAITIIEASIIFAAIFIAVISAALIVGPTVFMTILKSKDEFINQFSNNINVLITLIIIIIAFFLVVLFVVSTFMYAPYLVAFQKQKALEAIKNSYRGSMSNMMPITLFGFIALAINLLSVITLGLGFLVTFPILFCSYYASYKDIFEIAKSVEEPNSIIL